MLLLIWKHNFQLKKIHRCAKNKVMHWLRCIIKHNRKGISAHICMTHRCWFTNLNFHSSASHLCTVAHI